MNIDTQLIWTVSEEITNTLSLTKYNVFNSLGKLVYHTTGGWDMNKKTYSCIMPPNMKFDQSTSLY